MKLEFRSNEATGLDVVRENDRGISTEAAFGDLYRQLRRMARQRLAKGRPDRLLQTTELIHEVYLKFVHYRTKEGWDSQVHFLAAASETMRRIVVDRARADKSLKRGGGCLVLPIQAKKK